MMPYQLSPPERTVQYGRAKGPLRNCINFSRIGKTYLRVARCIACSAKSLTDEPTDSSIAGSEAPL